MDRTQTTLMEHHRDELLRSGISVEAAREAGVFTCSNRDWLASTLNWKKYDQTLGPALVFPYRDRTGAPYLFRIKPSNPRKDAHGRSRKYLQPSGAAPRLYVPPAAWEVASDPQARLLITEGEKKSISATAHGFRCIGIGGVEMWHAKRGMNLLPDFDAFEWQGRRVYVAFDSDAADNENVARNESLLSAALQRRGATVQVVRIPPAEDGGKQGLDDFLVAQGAPALERLLQSAEDPAAAAPDQWKLPAGSMDAAEEARRQLSLTTHDGEPKLVYWKAGFWLWHNGAYDEVRPEEMRTQIAKRIGQDYTNPRKSHVSDVLEYLAGEASVSSRREAPFWIREPHPDHAPSRCLTFRNGIFPMDQLLAGECDLLLPPTPNLFTPYALPVDYCPDLQAPERFLAFLNELWPDDEESVAALRQWFGYALLPDTSRQKIFCIIGPPRSGKGTIARVLEAMVGKRNVVWPSMSGLAGRFGMEQLVGKSLAICGETKVSGRFDATVALERLLGISGEDSVTIDRKNRPPLTCRLGTRFLLLGNDIPTFSDQSGAFASRLVMLATEHSFAAKQNRKLTTELLRELPEITNWAMVGWYLLQQADSFIQPSLGDELIEEVRASGAGVSQFVADRCVVEPGAVAYAKDLFAAWKEWCADEGRDQAGTRSWLIRNLRAAYPKLRSLRERQSGKQLRGLTGIRLK